MRTAGPRTDKMLIIAAAIILVCCDHPDSRTMRVRGLITSRTVESVVRRNPKTIIVTTTGAVSSAGLDLAEVVQQRGITLRIRGACASACAQTLVPASATAYFEPYSFIIFHNTATALQAVVADDPDPTVAHFFDNRAAREMTLYERAGVDRRLLLQPMFRMGVICYTVVEREGQVVDVRWLAQLEGWTASPEVLRHMGVSTQGHLPVNANDFSAALQRNRSRLAASAFWFEGRDPGLTFDQLRATLIDRPRCIEGRGSEPLAHNP